MFHQIIFLLLTISSLFCNFSQKTLAWINNFLCQRHQRHQRVAVNGSKSDQTPVVSGVPQGTVLGPVLFNIFINDIVDDVESEIRLFADDCVCYRPIANVQDCEQLQKNIDHLTSWAKKWFMCFEPSKCKIMHITRKTTHKITYRYTIEQTSLDSVQHTKYLGITISDDLRWNRHVADITGRANKLLGLLRRNLSTCDRRVKEAAYLGLVRPLLEYASQAQDPYTDNLSNEIEKTERRAARFVTFDYQNYEPGSVTTLLSCKSLEIRRKVDNRLCLLKKGLDNNAILPLDELSKPGRKTRHMHNRYYTTIYARTNIFKFSFVPRTIRDWNNLPHNVVEIEDDAKFRKSLLFTNLQKSADPRCKLYHSFNERGYIK